MSTRNLILILVPLIFIAGAALAFESRSCVGIACDSSSVSSGVIYDPDVENVVENFGQAMQRVPLLTDSATLSAQMDAQYGAYVAPELLSAWKASPQTAPGRQTSSPWPERIQIGQMQQMGNAFIVHGTVIDVVNGDDGEEEIVGTYPVELRLESRSGAWLITSFTRGDYSQIPARATITGTFTCLPHRDTSGPQTMECAFGVRDEASDEHYAVNTALMSSMAWQGIPTGERVRIEGVMTPIEQLSSNQWQKYDIVGIISATSIEQL